MKKKTGVAPGYLHGFTQDEQDRLYQQARFLEESIYEKIDFRKQNTIVEVGCGVGAQTEILLERFPHLKISGIDAAPEQIARAKARLKKSIVDGRVKLDVGDALNLPYKDNSFDGAFICWFLEHVQEPVGILKEVKRVLNSGAVIYCNEVLNATFHLQPYTPATLQYWFAFNDHQWSMKGDPFVGGKLANYLLAAGYQNVSTEVLVHHYDNRSPKKRAKMIEYWMNLLLSGAPSLLKAGKVTEKTVKEMQRELLKIKDDPDAVFFYSWVQARANAF